YKILDVQQNKLHPVAELTFRSRRRRYVFGRKADLSLANRLLVTQSGYNTVCSPVIGKLGMPFPDAAVIVLAGIALFAAFVNGAIGYGFSSLTVPLALIFYTNRVLNPAVVVIEVALNLYVLFINLSGVPTVWRRVLPILVGMLPGIAIGASVLTLLQPGW